MTQTVPVAKGSAFRQRLEWILDPVAYLQKNHQQYPDLFITKSVGFGYSPIYVSHPEALQQILTNDRREFSAPGDMNETLRPITGDSSLFLLSGEQHKQRRQLLAPPFHGERLLSYGQAILDTTEQVMRAIPPHHVFVGRRLTQKITLQVILQVVFGIYEGERYQKIQKNLTEMLDSFDSPLNSAFLLVPALQKDWGAWSPWGRFQRQKQSIDALIYEELAERRKNLDPNATDILSLMMSARYEDGSAMSDTELRDELMTLLLAGHETTATAIAWALYWVYRQPDAQSRLLAEFQSLGNDPDPMEIAKLPYLTAFCNETLRLTPVAMLTFPRVAQKPVELLGYSLEAGTILLGCMFLTHRRQDLYPNPQQFRPERFLERKYSPYEFIPFGNGSRRCIGDTLAQFEMKLALFQILSYYDLALAETKPERLQRRGLTLTPARGVKLILNGRKISLSSSREVARI